MTTTADELREEVRRRYAASALAVTTAERRVRQRLVLRERRGDRSSARRCTRRSSAPSCPDAAVLASLGCGNPTAVAELREGEMVLDLGSGGGIDVILSARRVGPSGPRVRARHDRRDARARAGATPRRPASRTRSSSRA